MVEDPPLFASVTTLPASGFPYASLIVAVIVAAVTPSATTELGAAASEEPLAAGAAGAAGGAARGGSGRGDGDGVARAVHRSRCGRDRLRAGTLERGREGVAARVR